MIGLHLANNVEHEKLYRRQVQMGLRQIFLEELNFYNEAFGTIGTACGFLAGFGFRGLLLKAQDKNHYVIFAFHSLCAFMTCLSLLTLVYAKYRISFQNLSMQSTQGYSSNSFAFRRCQVFESLHVSPRAARGKVRRRGRPDQRPRGVSNHHLQVGVGPTAVDTQANLTLESVALAVVGLRILDTSLAYGSLTVIIELFIMSLGGIGFYKFEVRRVTRPHTRSHRA